MAACQLIRLHQTRGQDKEEDMGAPELRTRFCRQLAARGATAAQFTYLTPDGDTSAMVRLTLDPAGICNVGLQYVIECSTIPLLSIVPVPFNTPGTYTLKM